MHLTRIQNRSIGCPINVRIQNLVITVTADVLFPALWPKLHTSQLNIVFAVNKCDGNMKAMQHAILFLCDE